MRSRTRSSSRRTMAKEQIMIVNLSGRGDKDMQTVANAFGVTV